MKKSTIVTVVIAVGFVFLGGAMFAQNINDTGPNSNNQITQESNTNCDVNNSNDINVNNNNNQTSNSGSSNNSNNTNSGSSSTGSSNNNNSTNTNVSVDNNNNCVASATTAVTPQGGKGGAAGGAGAAGASSQVEAPVGGVGAGSINLVSSFGTVLALTGSLALVTFGAKQLRSATRSIDI